MDRCEWSVKYKVVGVMHTNFVAIVEAESEEEASRIAEEDKEDCIWVEIKNGGDWHIEYIEED